MLLLLLFLEKMTSFNALVYVSRVFCSLYISYKGGITYWIYFYFMLLKNIESKVCQSHLKSLDAVLDSGCLECGIHRLDPTVSSGTTYVFM
jgi:hypothetical protein